MSLVLQTIQGVAGGVAHGLRVLAFALLLLDVAFPIVIAGLAFWLAADGSAVRGAIAAVLAVLLGLVSGAIVSFNIAAVSAARAAVERATLGRVTLDAIVERMPCSTEAGWSLDEIESGLNDAATAILGEERPAGITGLAFRLASRVQKVVVWTTVRIVLRQCAREHEGEERVDLGAVRDRLADTIDRMLLARLREQTLRVSVAILGVAASVAVVLALLVRQLPL